MKSEFRETEVGSAPKERASYTLFKREAKHMTPEMIDGLSVTLVITLATCALCPIFWWILPDRTSYTQH